MEQLVNDGSDALDSLHYIEEENFICNLQGKSFNVTSNQMKQIKGKSIETNKLQKIYGPIPSQEEIRKIIRERSLNTSKEKSNWCLEATAWETNLSKTSK
jgi:hypothetical protein